MPFARARAKRLARGPSGANGKLLERCLLGKHQLEPRVRQPLLRVPREGHAGLPQLSEPLRSQQAQVHKPGERQQRLVGGDVRGRLLAPDVLLAGLQGQHIAALTRGVDRLADDPPRQAPDVVVARGEEPVVRAAVAHRVTGRLTLADRHRAAVSARRLEHAERHQVDVRDRQRPGVVRRGGELGRVLEVPEEVRVLEDHGGSVDRRLAHAVRDR